MSPTNPTTDPNEPRPNEPRRGGEKREAILDGALTLFAERGFHGTTVPEIAREAGVGAGTIYRYFESKEALVNALYQTWKGRLVSSVVRGFPAGAPPREQFRHYWSRVARFVRDHRQAFTFLELHHHAPYLDERSRQIEQSLLDFARAFVAFATEQQVAKPLPADVLIAFVHGAFVGMVKAAYAGWIELDDETITQLESCAWEAIRA